MTNSVFPVIRDSFYELPGSISKLAPLGHRIMIAADSNTSVLFAKEVAQILMPYFSEVHTYVFEAGEEHKNLRSVEGLLRELISLHFDRKDCIAALGGGVVGDMAGFAASIYLRGIPVIQLPTTLLAQIDSSIGGKTGVDYEGFKNMVGAFHMPSLVYANTSAIQSLPEEQFFSGMGEVIKTALLADARLFSAIERKRLEILARKEGILYDLVGRCSEIKAEIVERDPKEKGERALLNLGHTIGHAIEKAKNFTMLHGYCVGAGLAAAARMSADRGYLTEEEFGRITDLCRYFRLPVKVEGLDPEEVFRYTKSDKKMAGGQIRFVLIRRIGEAFYTDDVTDEELMRGILSVLA